MSKGERAAPEPSSGLGERLMSTRVDTTTSNDSLWNSTCTPKVMVKQDSLERQSCSELISLVHVNNKGRSRAVPGNLEEIGQRSALVLAEEPVPVGSKVHIACKTHVLRGVAQSCTFDRILGFFVEVKLAPASRWSRRWFSPEHLTSFRDLAQLSHSA